VSAGTTPPTGHSSVHQHRDLSVPAHPSATPPLRPQLPHQTLVPAMIQHPTAAFAAAKRSGDAPPVGSCPSGGNGEGIARPRGERPGWRRHPSDMETDVSNREVSTDPTLIAVQKMRG